MCKPEDAAWDEYFIRRDPLLVDGEATAVPVTESNTPTGEIVFSAPLLPAGLSNPIATSRFEKSSATTRNRRSGGKGHRRA
jgi:hypothetical protein